MDQKSVEARLAGLRLGGIRAFERLGSTNDEAAAWAEGGAPDMALVVADEQTAGRGRAGRRWITPPSAGLAFSVVIRLADTEQNDFALPRLTALGALAVVDGLGSHYGLPAQVKWPNDILVYRQKIAGVLAEAQWMGTALAALILGIGINVAPAAVREAERAASPLRFPASSLEGALGRPVDRLEVLEVVLKKISHWRNRLSSPDFLLAWEKNLAFRGEWVQIIPGEEAGKDGPSSGQEKQGRPLEGQIVDLAPDGGLRLRTRSGEMILVRVGEVRLLPEGE